jgi:hypothetical protein
MPCFAAFGHAASRHMISAANLVRTLGESAFFNHALFGRGIARGEPRRHEMIFRADRALMVFLWGVRGMGGTESRRWDGVHRAGARLSGLYAGVRGGGVDRRGCVARARRGKPGNGKSWSMADLDNGRSGQWRIWAME